MRGSLRPGLASRARARRRGRPSCDPRLPNSSLGASMSFRTRARPPSSEGSALEPTHLLVEVNGLFGHEGNWRSINAALVKSMPASSETLVHASTVNARRATYHGVDACGDRLAREVKQIVAARPSLKRISFFGHRCATTCPSRSRHCAVEGPRPRARSSPVRPMAASRTSHHPLSEPFPRLSRVAWPAAVALTGPCIVEVDNCVRQRRGVVACSMGGLICRYAAGALFDNDSKRVAGLKPAHFLTMATPHLGCDTAGEPQASTAFDLRC